MRRIVGQLVPVEQSSFHSPWAIAVDWQEEQQKGTTQLGSDEKKKAAVDDDVALLLPARGTQCQVLEPAGSSFSSLPASGVLLFLSSAVHSRPVMR